MKRKTLTLKKRKPIYLGTTDPALFIRQNKTHRSVSEAFRDADYATAIWRCETDFDRTMNYIKPILAFVVAGAIIYIFCDGITKWLAN